MWSFVDEPSPAVNALREGIGNGQFEWSSGAITDAIAAGADVNFRRVDDGWTVLMEAAHYNNAFAAAALLEAGARIGDVDDAGRTAFDHAVSEGSEAAAAAIRNSIKKKPCVICGVKTLERCERCRTNFYCQGSSVFFFVV